jgi:hypothetical protein
MALLRDTAAAHPRVSATKVAAAGQGATGFAAAVILYLNRRFDLGLDQETILFAAGALVVIAQAVGTWAQRRASERIDAKLRPLPSGRELGR